MSNKKNNNSLLFLATLGVYIGLVLVGAPTGIVAQPAATTRNFSISDEFEVKENLDKDPDSDSSESINGNYLNGSVVKTRPSPVAGPFSYFDINSAISSGYSDNLSFEYNFVATYQFVAPSEDDTRLILKPEQLIQFAPLTISPITETILSTHLARSGIDA